MISELNNMKFITSDKNRAISFQNMSFVAKIMLFSSEISPKGICVLYFITVTAI